MPKQPGKRSATWKIPCRSNMRLDARKGDWNWEVYHVEWCCSLRDVQWLDDVTNEYARVIAASVYGVLTQVFLAKKILIIPTSRLVLINPVSDSGKDKRDLIVEPECVHIS